MKKIIFLDIDGVLAIESCQKNGKWRMCDEKQQLLFKIIKQTGAKIVLSSSWRKETMLETLMHMRDNGFWFCSSLVGITIRGHNHISKKPKYIYLFQEGLR